jgi:ubiquinone/menaquinone biosynthesis C-methylase UbiE
LLIKKVESKTLPLPDKICDMVCLITVLHEIKEKELMINEIKRILKRDGRLLVVDFHKKETPMGPPVNCRISIEGLCSLLKRKGLKIADKIIEGDNFYGLVFEM